MKNKKIICCDCGNEFDFTPRDQKFFAEKGFQDPKRCKSCRFKKKQQRAEQEGGVNNA